SMHATRPLEQTMPASSPPLPPSLAPPTPPSGSGVHMAPPPGLPSSTTPSQSSSRLLQTSAVGSGASQPSHAPAVQVSVPTPQALEHARVRPSSIRPLQSSSRLLQASTRGVGAVQPTYDPATQTSVPVPH